jgi:hypothetical protein
MRLDQICSSVSYYLRKYLKTNPSKYDISTVMKREIRSTQRQILCMYSLQNITAINYRLLITVAAWSEAWTVFTRSNAWILGSNPTKGMDDCVHVYSVFVLSLRRADHTSKESYRLFKIDYENEKEARAQQKSVEPLMTE